MSDWEKVNLGNIAAGGAAEQFDAELAAVIQNILDPNTDAAKIREIHLVLKMRPDKDDRARVTTSVEVFSKISRAKSIGTVMYVGQEHGELVAYEQDIRQPALFEEDQQDSGKVKIIKGAV